MARSRFREGVGYFDQRDYEKARLAFMQAYALKPHPAVLLNLAQSELRGGYPSDAATHFAQYLRENPEAGPAERQEAELGFDAARAKVAQVSITVDSPGALIFVNGHEKGTSPLPGPLFLDPGTYSIEARKDGEVATTTSRGEAGQKISATLALTTERGEPHASEGSAGSAAPVGEEASVAPEDYSPGPGQRPFFTWLFDTPAAMALAGLGVAGLGSAGVLAITANSDFNSSSDIKQKILTAKAEDVQKGLLADADAPCALTLAAMTKLGTDRTGQYATACKKYDSAVNSAEFAKTMSLVTLGIGVAGVGATVVYYFVDPGAREGASARRLPLNLAITPVLTGSVQGLSVTGSF